MIPRCGCPYGQDAARRPSWRKVRFANTTAYIFGTCQKCGNTGLVLDNLISDTVLAPFDLAIVWADLSATGKN